MCARFVIQPTRNSCRSPLLIVIILFSRLPDVLQHQHVEATPTEGPVYAHHVARLPEADTPRVRLHHGSGQGHAQEQPAHGETGRGEDEAWRMFVFFTEN